MCYRTPRFVPSGVLSRYTPADILLRVELLNGYVTIDYYMIGALIAVVIIVGVTYAGTELNGLFDMFANKVDAVTP